MVANATPNVVVAVVVVESSHLPGQGQPEGAVPKGPKTTRADLAIVGDPLGRTKTKTVNS